MIWQQTPQSSQVNQVSRLALDRYFPLYKSVDFTQPVEVYPQRKSEDTMDRSPAMQFYFRQFAADESVMVMDLDAIGAHILLMCMAGASQELWRVPSDDRKIRCAIRNPNDADWARIKAQLLDGPWKVSVDGKWWVQMGMMRTFQKQKAFHKSASERGKLGAAARWGSGQANGTGMAEPLAEPLAKHGSASASASASAILKPTPPTPPSGGSSNTFVFECQKNLVVTVHVPVGRKLWRTGKDQEKFETRCNEQARGYRADLVEIYFKLQGFAVEVSSAEVPHA